MTTATDLRGQRALVTGGARGIGAAVARRLAADGWSVVVVDRCSDDPALDYALGSRDQLDAVVADCGGDAVGVVADVGDRDGLAAALQARGPFDAVVCAAGVVWGGRPVWETPADAWESLWSANVTGVLNVAAATIPGMLAGRDVPHGRFVAIASAAGIRGLQAMGGYSAAKHAVVGLVRSLAADLAESGITANAVAPGSVDTDILTASAEVYDLGSPAEFARHHLSGRLLHAGEIAEAVAWLCSPAASGVTGAVLPVDAGMTAT